MIAIIAAGFGALFGSFLNVCIARWPVDGSVFRPARSHCPHCGHAIRWYENIPVLSWLALRGRCSGCAAGISPQYPLIELSTAALWWLAFWGFGPTLTALRFAVLATILLGVAVTDAKHYVIPDGFTVTGLIVVLATSVLGAMTGDVGPFAAPIDALYGACVGAGAIAIVGWLGEVALKKEAMGFGDVTLMAVCGAALGPPLVLLNVFVAALLGVVVSLLIIAPLGWWRARARGEPFALPQIPFGTFLAPAALVTLLYGERVLELWRAYVLG
jgi:leader peptidase (prepilin peptidase) / N-methyltransferase